MQEAKMDIFISYSTPDEAKAREIESKLKDRNKSCFLAPNELKGGDPFKEKIRAALREAKEIFVLLTPSSLKSEWVITEWGAAWVLEKHIVPILYRCDIKSIPARLRDFQTRDFDEIDRIIDEFEERQRNQRLSPPPSKMTAERSRVLLFDIDGTVLNPLDNLQTGTGLQFVQLLRRLADKGYFFVFITGNDFDLQQKRILTPIKEQGLGSSVFCFSDGGSRAFESNEGSGAFEEIQSYSNGNLMNNEQVETITRVFKSTLQEFLAQKGNDVLLRPRVRWIERRLDHLDISIFPLRPSFIKNSLYEQFCSELQELFKDSSIQNAAFELIRTFPGGLIIRAYGKNPESDANRLQDLIFHNLLFRKEYNELSMPEAEIRGGRVVCQIALKPFNDEDKRNEFRKTFEQELRTHGSDQFSVSLGGRTTIDVQIKGVNKQKAVRYLIQHKKLDPQKMIYFGNEFGIYGNDRTVLDMGNNEKPGLIVNVGDPCDQSGILHEVLLEDHNGPGGTLNYLKLLLHETP
jgi:hydroxymethylpyrimidine pyrophosphatase-like HAD family hydrolase